MVVVSYFQPMHLERRWSKMQCMENLHHFVGRYSEPFIRMDQGVAVVGGWN